MLQRFSGDTYARYAATTRSFIRGTRVRLSVRSVRRCIIVFAGPNATTAVHVARVCKNVTLYRERILLKTVIQTKLRILE